MNLTKALRYRGMLSIVFCSDGCGQTTFNDGESEGVARVKFDLHRNPNEITPAFEHAFSRRPL